MPFTRAEQAAVHRVRNVLDSIPTAGGVPLIPTGAGGPRPDAFVPVDLAGRLNATLALEQDAVWGMDPRDWTRELAKPVLDVRWPSRMALTYMQACSATRRRLDVRHYWTYVWAMFDAGLVVADAMIGVAPNRDDQTSAALVTGQGFRTATPVELDAHRRTQAQAGAYAATLTQSVAALGERDYWPDLLADVGAVGREAVSRGITGRPSEVTTAWLAERGVTGQTLSEVAHLANRALYPYGNRGFGLTTPAHGWWVASAYNDGAAEWSAAQTAYVLAGYVDPDFVTPTPTAPWETGTPGTPPWSPPGTGDGPVIGEVPDIREPDSTPGGGTPGGGTPTTGTPGGTPSGGTLPAPNTPRTATTIAAGLTPAAWLAIGAGAAFLFSRR